MKCSPLAVIAQKNSAHHSRQIASGHAVLKFLCALLMTLSMTANVWAGKGGAGGGGTLAAPSGLTAAGISTNQIQLSWVDNSSTESGFKIVNVFCMNDYLYLLFFSAACMASPMSAGLLTT